MTLQDYFPSQITDNIWLGGNRFFLTTTKNFLVENKIDCIISIHKFGPPDFAKSYIASDRHLYIDIEDLESEDITKYIDKSNKFIDNAIDNKRNIYIHCEFGISRSPAFILAYLTYKNGKSIYENYTYIIKKRAIVDINNGFKKQLADLYNG